MEKINLRLKNKLIRVWVANDNETRERGLSGVSKLKQDEGMLFVFKDDDKHAVWMKGMLFPIDVIWFDTNWKVVGFVENATPCAATNRNCETYYPNAKARYILEVPAKTGKFYI
jgi:uncharacterized membrane protein (UPF0127 family)